jgi:hypothetical protein
MTELVRYDAMCRAIDAASRQSRRFQSSAYAQIAVIARRHGKRVKSTLCGRPSIGNGF